MSDSEKVDGSEQRPTIELFVKVS